jgi:hypothetical protein
MPEPTHESAANRRDLDQKDFIESYCVSTVLLGFEHYNGWYETYIFPADGEKITGWLEVWGQRYWTYEEAVAGHAKACSDLRDGELELHD